MPILTPEEAARAAQQQQSYTSTNKDVTQALQDYDAQFYTGSRETDIGDIYPKTYSQYDLTIPYGEYDINEWRAQQQSVGNRLLKTAPRIINTALSEVAKMPGYAVGLGMAATTDLNIGDALDNAWTRGIEKAKEYVGDEFLSIYVPEKVKNGNLLDNLGSSSFWATEGADGVGFMLSFLTPGILLRAVSAGAKGAELLNLATKAAKLGDTGTDLVRGGVRFGEKAAKNIEDIGSVVINATLESAAEATESYKTALQTYKQQGYSDDVANEMAGKAAAGTFATNMALLSVTGAISQRQLFGAFRGKGDKGILGQLFDEQGKLIEGLGAKSIVQKLPKAGKELAKGILSEGFLEEGLQSAAQKYYQDRQIHPDDYDTVLEGLVGSYIEGLDDVDMQKAILLGSVLGGMQGAISTYRELGEEDKQLYGSGAKSPSKLLKSLGVKDREATKGVYGIMRDGLIEQLNLDSVKDLFVKKADGTYELDERGRRIPDETKLGELITKAHTKDGALAIMAIAKEIGDTKTFNRYFLGSKVDEFLPFLKEDNGLELLNKYIDSQLAQSEVDKYGESFGLKVNEVKNSLKTFAKSLDSNYKSLSDTHSFTFKVPKGEDVSAWNDFNNKVFNNKLDAAMLIDQTVAEINKLKEEKGKITSKSEDSRTVVDDLLEHQIDKAIKLNESIIQESKDELKNLTNKEYLNNQFELFKAKRQQTKQEVADSVVNNKEVDLSDLLKSKGYPDFNDAKRSIYFDNGNRRLVAQKDAASGKWFIYSDQDLSTPLLDSSKNPIIFDRDYYNANKSKLTILSRNEAAQRIVDERKYERFKAEFQAAVELVKLKTSKYKENEAKIKELQTSLDKYKALLKSNLKGFSTKEAEEFIQELNDTITSIELEIDTLEQQNSTLSVAIEFLTQRVVDAQNQVGWYSPQTIIDKLEQGLNTRIDSLQITEKELFSPEQAQEIINVNNEHIASLQDALQALISTRDSIQKIVDRNKKLRKLLLDALSSNLLKVGEKTTARQVAAMLEKYAAGVNTDTFVATINEYDTREIVHFINTELSSIQGGKKLTVDQVIDLLDKSIQTNEAPLIALRSEIQDLEAEVFTLQSKTKFLSEGLEFSEKYKTYQPILEEWKVAANKTLAAATKPNPEQTASTPELEPVTNEEAIELLKKSHTERRIDAFVTGGKNFEFRDGYGSIYPEKWDEDGYPTPVSDEDQQRWFKYLDSMPDLQDTVLLYVSYRHLDKQDIPTTLKEVIKSKVEGTEYAGNAIFVVLADASGNPKVSGNGQYYFTSLNTTERLFDGDRPLLYLDKLIAKELLDSAASGDESTVSKLFSSKTEGNEILTWQGMQHTKDELYEMLVNSRKASLREEYDNWRLEILNTIATKGVAYSMPQKVSDGVPVTHKTDKFLIKESAGLKADPKDFANRGWKILIGKSNNKVVTTKGNTVAVGRAVIETSDGTEIFVNMPNLNEEQVNTVIALLRYAVEGNQAGLNKHVKLAGDKYTYVDGKKTNGTYPIFPNANENGSKSTNKNSLLSNLISWGRVNKDIPTSGEVYLDTANREVVFVPYSKEPVPQRIKFDDLLNGESEGYQMFRSFLFTKRLNINEAALSNTKPILYLQPKVNGARLAIGKDGLEVNTTSSYDEYLLNFMQTPIIPKNNKKGLPQFAQRHIELGREIKTEFTAASTPVKPTEGKKIYTIKNSKTGSTTTYSVESGVATVTEIVDKDGNKVTSPDILNMATYTIQKDLDVFIKDSTELVSPSPSAASPVVSEVETPEEISPEDVGIQEDELSAYLDEIDEGSIISAENLPSKESFIPTTPVEPKADAFNRKKVKIDHSIFLAAYSQLVEGSVKNEYSKFLDVEVWNNLSSSEQEKTLKCINQ